jgi:hypothetical protein
MTVAVAVTPASGRAKVSVLRIDVTGLADTAFDQYNPAAHPAEPQVTYYIEATKDGTRYLKSHVFTPAQDGTHTWNSIVLPSTGTWVFAVATVSGDVTQGSTTFVAS